MANTRRPHNTPNLTLKHLYRFTISLTFNRNNCVTIFSLQ